MLLTSIILLSIILQTIFMKNMLKEITTKRIIFNFCMFIAMCLVGTTAMAALTANITSNNTGAYLNGIYYIIASSIMSVLYLIIEKDVFA